MNPVCSPILGRRRRRQIVEVRLEGHKRRTDTPRDSLRSGAEALYFKPILNFEPLLEILSDSFRKTDRWRQTLEELRMRRAQSLVTTA